VTPARRRAHWFAAALALVAAALAPRAASAACAPPDLLEAIPPDGATVPVNASLFAHYESTAEYANEDVLLDTLDELGAVAKTEVVKVTFDSTQGLLTFAPNGNLPPGTYVLHWPRLRGLNVAAPGLGKDVKFTMSAVSDDAPPSFDGVISMTWDLERKHNDCTDRFESRFAFDLELAPADDDGGRKNLTLVVFQTEGGLADGGTVPVVAMAMPEAGKTVAVKLPVADATGHICFAALARDLTGKTSNGGSHEVCLDTRAPPFFKGCAVAPGGGRGATLAGAALVVSALVARRRGRGARARRR
jgi:hypothetical protein